MTSRPHRAPLLLALLAAASLPGCRAAEPGGSESQAEAEALFQLLATAIQDADTALIEDLFWPEATYEDFATQQEYRGLEEIVGYLTARHRWADGVYWNAGRVHATLDGAVGEWVFSGVHARPIGGLVPEGTGREVVLYGVTILELEGDRIIRAADYTDTAPLWLQLGGRITLPGGEIIEWDGN